MLRLTAGSIGAMSVWCDRCKVSHSSHPPTAVENEFRRRHHTPPVGKAGICPPRTRALRRQRRVLPMGVSSSGGLQYHRREQFGHSPNLKRSLCRQPRVPPKRTKATYWLAALVACE